ncbi:rhodanese domain-containing protein CG4456-like isoform X2 [Drosophila bipectinata]|uniref:rhodanese domain-containing protein CG4456-like isoform X2 n=1 Tax=Drosophila bipectinata TaxID=42026 RepID=UPI001C88EF68|nr:rhodanese domain-containing protein CG4456-like [Drosophila bipectinata]
MSLLESTGRLIASKLKNQTKLIFRQLASIVTYEEVKDVPNKPEICLIDVRRREELKETGRIPASINIPLDELEDALTLERSNFKLKYGRAKPQKDTKIIFSCRSGKRALEAEKIAKALGYTNLSLYSGSWLDWANNEGL